MKEALHGEEDRLLKTSDVTEITGFTKNTIAKMLADESFPEPDFISESGYRHWWKSSIYAFFNKKAAVTL